VLVDPSALVSAPPVLVSTPPVLVSTPSVLVSTSPVPVGTTTLSVLVSTHSLSFMVAVVLLFLLLMQIPVLTAATVMEPPMVATMAVDTTFDSIKHLPLHPFTPQDLPKRILIVAVILSRQMA
jgi:hypothetical protein